MKRLINTTVLMSVVVFGLYAQDSSIKEEKDITIIHGQSVADGKSEVSERILEECIVSLPKADQLEPEINSSSVFLKEINGDPSKNDFVKTYSATLEINYMLYQKVLIVVATSSVKGQEPVMKVMEKNLKQSKRFTSNSSSGDLYAGRSKRQHYFSTPEGAAMDVRQRASAWLKQQAAVVCTK
ncbi:MAG TPA: hypothetical protein VKY57_06580 [Chitinispirillaceae bacterium]|nr:hypothetical protein [Chitinispirillaceae bacterium]